MTSVLDALSNLLARSGQPRWSSLMAVLAQEARDASTAHERRAVVQQVMRLFAGMGSLNDLVLQDARGVRPEQHLLDELREDLYRAAGEEAGGP